MPPINRRNIDFFFCLRVLPISVVVVVFILCSISGCYRSPSESDGAPISEQVGVLCEVHSRALALEIAVVQEESGIALEI